MDDKNKSSGNYESSLQKKLNEFQNELDSYKKHTEKFMDSYNFILKTLFLDYEVNQPRFLVNHFQLISYELLKFVKKVCEKHEITWWLDFGNLLGAVRHGMFVPWDDDMDIGMMRQDYLNFDKIIAQEVKNHDLSDIVKVGYRPFKPGIPSFIQLNVIYEIRPEAFKVLGNVDVFPYEYINDFDENIIEEVYRKAKNEYLHHRENDFNLTYSFDKYYEDLNLSWKPTEYIIPGWENPCTPDDMYKLVIYQKNKILPLSKIYFVDEEFPCPNDTHYYLNKLYGDYMNIPKILRKHDRVKKFIHIENNGIIFKERLNAIKKANENFNMKK